METSIYNSSVRFTHGQDMFEVVFHRTLRLPEDGQTHPLPPSLGVFPLKRVEDYRDKVPASWNEHGGVFLPLWQREALWLGFRSSRRPFATKVAAGKINAVSGKPWAEELAPSDTSGSGDPRQDYLVAPPQPWLDGFNAGNGVIKQFVAMPLGMGYTVEGQVTGEEKFGGIQIMALPPKPGLLEPKPRNPGILRSHSSDIAGSLYSMSFMDQNIVEVSEMGLGAGGSMEQKIYPDPHGIDTWDTSASGRLYVHFINSQMYEQITGEKPPTSPITAQSYTSKGYPWYKLWDEEMGDVSASKTLQGVKTVGQKDKDHGFSQQQDDSPVASMAHPVLIGTKVKNGVW